MKKKKMSVSYLGDGKNLYLDISSTCTGFVIASMDRAKKTGTVHKAGILFFNSKWTHGRKYRALQEFITDVAFIRHQIQNVIVEGYMVNPKRICGTLVIPEMTGAVQAACYESSDEPLGFYRILPQSWRAALKIKKNTKYSGVKAWKQPTKRRIQTLLGVKIPDKIKNVIDGKLRKTPYDLVDSLGVCMGWLSKDPNGCKKFKIEDNAFD